MGASCRIVTARVPLLHVTNGDSTASTLRRTRLGGDVLAWRDVLHAGPVPAGSRRSVLAARAGFLAAAGFGDAASLAASLEERDRQLVEALRAGEVVLWFEHDLYDQLQLVDVLALVGADGGAADLIVVGSFPGRPSFRGLGELSADELETLWPSRTPAAGETLGAAAAVWGALREPEPTALAGEARIERPGLPYLGAALRRLLAELPSPRDGLSATERHALEAIAGGATTRSAAFAAAQDLEEAPFLGDTWFLRELDVLATGARPLVAAPGGLRLTSDGERVLAGELDRVELLGVDRWVGGTHVTAGNVWRWDPVASRLLHP